jgi:peroxisomal enoyl-CoA hydratase 2
MRQKLLGVWDKGKPGTVIETQTDLVDKDTDEVYATILGSVFAVGQGNWGGLKGLSRFVLELIEIG